MTQWSGLGTFTVMAQVKPLVRKLRPYKLSSTTKKKKKSWIYNKLYLFNWFVFLLLLFFLNCGKNTNMRPILLTHFKCMIQSIIQHNVVQ